MALVTSTEMFKKAYDGGYAIGAFNVNNMEIVQDALDAMIGTVNGSDVLVLQTGLDDAVSGAVDDGRRTAGLTDDQRTNELVFRHIFASKIIICSNAIEIDKKPGVSYATV